jgi:hypothetical protein
MDAGRIAGDGETQCQKLRIDNHEKAQKSQKRKNQKRNKTRIDRD